MLIDGPRMRDREDERAQTRRATSKGAEPGQRLEKDLTGHPLRVLDATHGEVGLDPWRQHGEDGRQRGWLAGTVLKVADVTGINIENIVVAVIGAIIVVAVYRAVSGRRTAM